MMTSSIKTNRKENKIEKAEIFRSEEFPTHKKDNIMCDYMKQGHSM